MSMRVPAEVRVLTHHVHALLLLRKLGSRVRVVEARESTALLRESFKSAIPNFDQASKTGAVVKRAMARIHTIKSKIATASQLNAALAELSPLEQEVCFVCVCVCFTQALIHHTPRHHPTLCLCVCFQQLLIHNPTPPLHATTLPTSATRLSTPPTNPSGIPTVCTRPERTRSDSFRRHDPSVSLMRSFIFSSTSSAHMRFPHASWSI